MLLMLTRFATVALLATLLAASPARFRLILLQAEKNVRVIEQLAIAVAIVHEIVPSLVVGPVWDPGALCGDSG